jgi:predicted RNA methylase
MSYCDESILEETFTDGLGRLSFYHPADTFSLTPASYVLINAIIKNRDLIRGIGIDWGSGVGCLAILAAKISSVRKVYGLEISKENIDASRENAKRNGVKEKVHFMLADSYCPFSPQEKQELGRLKGKVDFIVSNPPSSDWDDGFGFRRIVMNGAKDFIKKDGIVLLNISIQYGTKRVESLHKGIDGFRYLGVAASTDWVPFALDRPDLLDCLKVYTRAELNGEAEYTFSEDGSSDRCINAQTALNNYNKSGANPFTKWQTHIFRYIA